LNKIRAMQKILIKNIKGLVQVGENLPQIRKGKEMQELPILDNAFLALEVNDVIAYGAMSDWEGITDWRDLEVVDADGCFVFPSFCCFSYSCCFC